MLKSGEQGQTGPQGETGEPGADGAIGAKGDTGEPGSKGDQVGIFQYIHSCTFSLSQSCRCEAYYSVVPKN